MEHKKFGWTACAVNVQKNSLAISSALGVFMEANVDVFECANVFAFVNNPSGEYSAIPVSAASNRLKINSRPLVRHIQDKYGCCEPMKLDSWYDGAHVLFCRGDAGVNRTFHGGFRKVSNLFRFRYDNSIRIVGNRFIISSTLSRRLEQRLTFMELGNGFVFLNDRNGSLYATDKNEFGTKAVKSRQLAKYMLQKFGSESMYGIAVKGGVAFSQNRNWSLPEARPTEIAGIRRPDAARSV